MTGVHSLEGFADFPASCVQVESDPPVSCCQAFNTPPLKAQTKITIVFHHSNKKELVEGVFEIGTHSVAQAVSGTKHV